MRDKFENKTLGLELSADQHNIITAERKANAAKRRLAETQREIARGKENAELFGRPFDPDHLRALEHQEKQDAELVAQCERELADAKDAPARRVAEEKDAAALNREISNCIGEIEAWAERGAPLMMKADDLIKRVINVGTVNTGGWHALKPAFRGMETLLERLRFWARTTGANGDTETFADRLARYRRIGEPTPVPKPPTFTGTYQRSKPLPRQARENSAARLKMTPSGVETSR